MERTQTRELHANKQQPMREEEEENVLCAVQEATVE